MARKFINGFLIGSILGAIGSMFVSPQKKMLFDQRVLGKTRRVKNRAEKMVNQLSNGVRDISGILKKK